ncbi:MULTISPECIES: sensor histidine kinase [Bacillaceae]|uniref:histidine kinase n=1 Tax=Halalkalibacter alkaliphilus TaxID=2917993 RepID=A0A9X1ZZV0_9BACI|nr:MULTISPECIES: ATP-binding protein [Bacillaceae]MCL7746662.1 ATP-binding protein [Halalkalibacter alkaliphilus]MDT8860494.1 ATP-binding protein [Alkalihalobacillus sp. MEB130]
MNRIDIKLGLTILLLLITIILPLGFVMNQIFYGFYVSQAQEETHMLSSQYANLINDSTVENRLEVVEVAAKISNQKMIALSDEGEVWAQSNFVMSHHDTEYLLDLIHSANSHHYMTNSFEDSDGKTYIATASHINVNNAKGHVIVFSSLESIILSIKNVQNFLKLSAIGALFLGIGLTYFISKKLSQPLVSMEKAARQISKGNYNTRIVQKSGDELGTLARAINDLAFSLQRINDQRREFFANISHELRTPMTYLKGYSKVLREGRWKTEEERNQYLEIIDHEATRLTYLVNDLFDLAQMDEGRFNLEHKKVNINEIIKLVVKKTAYKALEQNLKIEYLGELSDKDDSIVLGDPLRLEQVLINLVENAIKYTKEGSITISTVSIDENIKIKVRDTGIGMEEDELPYIFERFYRVEKSRSRAFGGTGLGLSIVKQLIELQNGTIEVESTVGEGTEFTIILPKISD